MVRQRGPAMVAAKRSLLRWGLLPPWLTGDAPRGNRGRIVPISKRRPDGTPLRALARAWRWRKPLDPGADTLVTEVAEARSG